MIETRRLKNIVIFIQTIFKFWAVKKIYHIALAIFRSLVHILTYKLYTTQPGVTLVFCILNDDFSFSFIFSILEVIKLKRSNKVKNSK